LKTSKTLMFRRSSLALIALGALLLAGCQKEKVAAPEPLPVVSVRVQSIELKPHIATEDVVGTVRPKLQSVIEAKVSGQIEKLLVVPGQQVKTGEVLAQLNVREIQAKLDQALALQEQAESDLKRYSALVEKHVVTQQDFDAVQTRARVERAAVIEAETNLAYATITAPFDGVITRKLADVGDLASPGKPLLEMQDTNSLRLEADVPEAIIDRVEMGAQFSVQIEVQPNELEGVVSEIAPGADPNSRTFVVKLDLPPRPWLRAGQFGRVAIPVSETPVLRVPVSAVIQRGQMEVVFVVADKRAHLRLVKTGKRIGDEVELISGVDPAEQIVVDGASVLLDGQPVSIKS
jgi:RND family efflux transporter MFP subunit